MALCYHTVRNSETDPDGCSVWTAVVFGRNELRGGAHSCAHGSPRATPTESVSAVPNIWLVLGTSHTAVGNECGWGGERPRGAVERFFEAGTSRGYWSKVAAAARTRADAKAETAAARPNGDMLRRNPCVSDVAAW